MSAHTPGPWFLDPESGGISANGNPQLAIVPRRRGGTKAEAEKREAEAKANELLISLAPEMFEALSGLLSAYVGGSRAIVLAKANAKVKLVMAKAGIT